MQDIDQTNLFVAGYPAIPKTQDQEHMYAKIWPIKNFQDKTYCYLGYDPIKHSAVQTLLNTGLVLGWTGRLMINIQTLMPVSYTHLTLPTNREV